MVPPRPSTAIALIITSNLWHCSRLPTEGCSCYLMSLLGRWHDAEDVLQRASVLMWQKFDTFERGTDFVAWASTIAFLRGEELSTTVRAFAAPVRRRLAGDTVAERLADLPQQEDRMAALQLCLEQLGATERDLLQMAYEKHGRRGGVGRPPESRAADALQQTESHPSPARRCVQRRLTEDHA